MIKDKKDKSSSGGGGTSSSSSGNNNSGSGSSKNNNSSSSSSSASNPSSSSKSSSPSTSSSKTTNANSNNKSGSNNNSKNNILGIEEEIIEQGNSEQLIVTSIKHEDGSPPTNIIKKESTSQSTSSAAGSSSNPNNSNNNNNSNSNDSNNNNDTNDNKNSSSTNASLQDDKDSIGANDNSITDELLNNEDLGLPGSNSGNKLMGGMHIKTEDGCSDMGADNFVPMNPGGGGPGGGSCRMMSQTSPERIQPLPSNVVNKQSNNMEYMQQQSQIFVFSTQLANKGAECVLSGQFPSIIAYHCAQPGTKKILEKYPLKINQFTRQNPPPGWMANVNQMKNKNSRIPNPNNFMMKNNPMGMPQMPPQQQQNQGPGGMHPGGGGPFSQSCDMGNVGDNMMPWGPPGGPQMGLGDPLGNTGPNPNDPTIPNPMGFNPDGLVPDVSGSNNSGSSLPHQSPSSMSGGNLCNMDPTSPNISTLQGVKIPDENLTSEQMQHRKEKLEIINHLKSNLFKESEGLVPGGPRLPESELSPVMGPMQGGPGPMPAGQVPGPNPMSSGPGPQMPGGPGSQMPPKMGPMGPKMPPGMGPGPMNQCQAPFPMGPRMGMGMGGPPRGGNMCRPPGPMGMGPNNMNDPMGGGPMGGPMGDMPCRPMNPNMPMGPGNPNQMMGNMGMPHMQGNMNPMGMNQMGPGPGPNCNMPNQMGGMMGQKGMGPGGPNMMGPGPNSMQAQMEWNKLQHQYYEENKRKGMPGNMPGGMPGNMPGNMDMNLDHPGMQGMPGRPGMPPNMRNNPNVRGQQGPPPPYHQTPRSASVPIATQSPNPNSPNNPTSNLSLPSPRGGCNSTLNSPAAGDTNRPLNPQQAFKHMNPRQSPTASQDSPVGINRQMTSNPSTPISSHLSPSASLKDLEMGPNPNKEPNLMPVPSPQQISYLNTFEGQELTIQKQPNTNLKDGSSSIGAPNQSNINLDNRLPGQKTPTSQSDSRFSSSTPGSVSNHFPIPSSPHTPGGTPNPGDKNRINSAGPSPQGLQRSSSMMGNDSQPFPLSQPNPNDGNMPPFSTDSPNMPFGPNSQQNQQNMQQQQSQQQQQNSQQQSQQNPAGNPGNQKMGDFMGNPGKGPGEMGGGSPFPPCGRPENLPLNPNTSGIPNTKPSLVHDPISSLAQMSQQLTSNSMNGQGGGPPSGMMGGFVNNGMMGDMGPMSQMGQGGNMNMPGDGMGGMGGGPGPMEYGMNMGIGPGQFGPMGGPGGPRPMSPKIGPGPGMGGFPGPGGMPPRMMSRGPMGPGPYNGTNIQVKPGAPNTIQYLPARPQVSNTNPRGPPSLDFLRFAGPMNMDDMNKSNNQNMPFFPNQNAGGNMGSCGGGMDGDSPMGPMGGPMGGMGPNTPPGMMNQNPMMMRGMRGGNMMRFPGPPGNPCMMGNNNFNSSNNLGGNNANNMGGNDQMFPNNPNAQMFVPGPKGSPMGGPPLGQNGPNQVPNSNSMNGPPPPEMQQQMQQQMMAQGGGPGPGGPHFNKSHYVGPNTADPNYAQQYHNFQQQLYATNTRNQQGPMGGMGGPNNNQQFLMPK